MKQPREPTHTLLDGRQRNTTQVLLTITWMLTIHMQKLTNFAVDAAGLSGAAAKGKAAWTPVLRRSVITIGSFARGSARWMPRRLDASTPIHLTLTPRPDGLDASTHSCVVLTPRLLY